MISALISAAILFGIPTAVFLLIASSGQPGGVGTEAIDGAIMGYLVFLVAGIVVIVNYAWGGWW